MKTDNLGLFSIRILNYSIRIFKRDPEGHVRLKTHQVTDHLNFYLVKNLLHSSTGALSSMNYLKNIIIIVNATSTSLPKPIEAACICGIVAYARA